jgi:hypothetical protein
VVAAITTFALKSIAPAAVCAVTCWAPKGDCRKIEITIVTLAARARAGISRRKRRWVKDRSRMRPLRVLAHQHGGDDEPADHEEDVDPDESAVQGCAGMEEQDQDDGQGSQPPVDIRAKALAGILGRSRPPGPGLPRAPRSGRRVCGVLDLAEHRSG